MSSLETMPTTRTSTSIPSTEQPRHDQRRPKSPQTAQQAPTPFEPPSAIAPPPPPNELEAVRKLSPAPHSGGSHAQDGNADLNIALKQPSSSSEGHHNSSGEQTVQKEEVRPLTGMMYGSLRQFLNLHTAISQNVSPEAGKSRDGDWGGPFIHVKRKRPRARMSDEEFSKVLRACEADRRDLPDLRSELFGRLRNRMTPREPGRENEVKMALTPGKLVNAPVFMPAQQQDSRKLPKVESIEWDQS